MGRWAEGRARRAWTPALLAAGLALLGAVCRAGQAPIDLGPIDPPLTLLKLSPKDLRVKATYTEDQVGGGGLRLSLVTDGLRGAVGSVAGAASA